MKSRTLTFGVICLIILISIVIACASFVLRSNARRSLVRYNITSLAKYIEKYREDKGEYPTSLTGLVSGSGSREKDEIKQILNDYFKDQYDYQPETNGFIIVVSKPNMWFIKHEQFERKYNIGEAFQQ
jgi:hypothetical protein